MNWLKNTYYRPLWLQLILALPIYLLLFSLGLGIIFASSASYGVLISVTNVIIVLITNQLGQKIAQTNPKQGIGLVFVFAGVRFVMIGVLFAIGIGWLGLDAFSMLLSFIWVHIGGQVLNLMMNLNNK